MIAGQVLDEAMIKLQGIKDKVKEVDIEALVKRNEFGKHVICSRSTFHNYMNGKGTNEDMYKAIYHFLNKRIEKR